MYRKLLVCLLLLIAGLCAFGRSPRAVRDSLWSEASELSRHGRFEESTAMFLDIKRDYKLSRKYLLGCYSWLICNADLAGDYKSMYEYLKEKQAVKPFDAEMKHFELLSALPPQTVSRPACDDTVHYLVDSLFYEGEFKGCEIKIPVVINGREEFFQIDNGCAKYSFATQSFALVHGIRPLGVEGDAVGVVDRVSMWMGTVDSLSIGRMMFRNLIFVVVPDAAVENPVTKITALVGANIFRLAGEMQFDNVARTIVFPCSAQERESNLTVDSGGTHYLEASVEGDSLKMQLDLGASSTALNANYFEKYKAKVVKNCKCDSTYVGGIGGFKRVPVYIAPEIAVEACGGTYIKKNLKISTDSRPNEASEMGAVGNDFLLYFKRVCLNLDRMYMYVQ